MQIPQGLQQLREIVLAGEHGAIHIDEQLQSGGPYQAWYPSLRSSRPQLLVTLHTDSLDAATGDEATARDWLIDTGGHTAHRETLPDADLAATTCRNCATPAWAASLPILGTKLRSEFTQSVYAQSLRPDWEKVRTQQQPPAGLLDLELHALTKRHLFVTLDTHTLDVGLTPELRTQALVVKPRLAQRYVDLYLKAHDAYRVWPRNTVNRGRYYWLRLWACVPAFPSAWAYAVFGEKAAPDGVMIRNFMRALYARLMGMMAAHDRIGWLRYMQADNDTRDEMLNQLNYFIVLATGAFDSLAWLANYRFQIHERKRMNITVRAGQHSGSAMSFFKKLDAVAPAFATYLRDPHRQARVELFYEPRDAIQHRLVLTGAHFNTGQYPSDCNVVAFLDEETAQAFEAVDRHDPAEEPPFRVWGMLRFSSDGSSILEPYRFTGAALKFLFAFINGGLAHLELDHWLEQADPQMKTEADATIAYGVQVNYPQFATPFPWIPTVSVL